MSTKLDADAFFGGEPPPSNASLEGAELTRAYWRSRALAAELARKERYWANICEGLASAYAELERAGSERIEQLEQHVSSNVSARSRKLVAMARELAGRTVHLEPGTVLNGRTHVGEPIGEGGSAVVYRAKDDLLGDGLAVKVLRRVHEPDARLRFLAEAEAASRARHPAIVRPLHLDVSEDGLPYIVMAHVEGRSLRAHLAAKGPLVPRVACRLGAVLVHALAGAHEAGIVHRDVKPGNVMLTPKPPGLRVLDFGLALALVTGRLTGTPAYMAPEQILDPAHAGAPADVYAAGVMLYEMLAGRPPFYGASVDAVTRAHLDTPPPSLAGPPEDLVVLVGAMLAKRAADRPTALEAAKTLDGIADRLGALTAHAEAVSLLEPGDALTTL